MLTFVHCSQHAPDADLPLQRDDTRDTAVTCCVTSPGAEGGGGLGGARPIKYGGRLSQYSNVAVVFQRVSGASVTLS